MRTRANWRIPPKTASRPRSPPPSLSPPPCPTPAPHTHTLQDAQHALAWVLDNLARPGDGIHILHALPEAHPAAALQIHPGMWIPVGEDEDGGDEGVDDAAAAAAVAMIRRRFTAQLPAAGLPYEVHLLPVADDETATVAAALAAKAASLGAACLVVAHHPASPLRSWWRGSVAADAARAPRGVPTLVVH